jgi:hypothetical protein
MDLSFHFPESERRIEMLAHLIARQGFYLGLMQTQLFKMLKRHAYEFPAYAHALEFRGNCDIRNNSP